MAYYAQEVITVSGVIGDYYFSTNDNGEHLLSYYNGKDKALTLPEDYKGDDYMIKYGVFQNNDSIVSVVIPQSVWSIGKSAFAGCDNLAAVTIPRGVMDIGDKAFENCTSLTAIDIPQRLSAVGKSAFAGCSNLTTLTLGEDVETIGAKAFENCVSLSRVVLPEGIVTVGYNAFSGCSGLVTLVINENIETFGEDAFKGCVAVESLTVKGGVMPTVPSSALTSITMFSPAPLETEEFASKVYRNATVYVPVGSLSRYQNADVWKKFWNIVEFDPTGIEGITVDDTQAPVYNIKGVRVSDNTENLPAGIYIRNGKKFVVM